MNTIGTIFGGVAICGLLFGGLFKVGRMSVKLKIVELEELKVLLLDSRDSHDDLVFDIDNKLEELKDYNKQSICGKSKIQ